MSYPKLRTSQGKLMAVHNGQTLARLARLQRLAYAAREVVIGDPACDRSADCAITEMRRGACDHQREAADELARVSAEVFSPHDEGGAA